MSSARKKVFIGMSGGVDSSVAALLLKKEGYDVVGVFMRCWSGDGPDAAVGVNCTAEQDAEDARRVAGHIGIPFYVWDFEEEYKKRVVEYMVEGYRAGITPNPDVMCNREIKFGLFLEKALSMGADYIATGHYVRLRRTVTSKKEQATRQAKPISHVSLPMSLFSARDAQKDQSYFLWTLGQKQLVHCLFPIGDYKKPQVRVIARKAGLPTAGKKDSQGICFLGKVTLADFLVAYIPEHPGKVITASGKVIGTHRGAEFYTIGQRHIGVANGKWKMEKGKESDGKSTGNARPIYVASKDIKSNTLIVAQGDDDPSLYRKEIRLTDVNFINPIPNTLPPKVDPPLAENPIPCFARVRYRQPLSEAILVTCDKEHATRKNQKASIAMSHVACPMSLVFKKPQKFVAEGQSAVFYTKSGEMLGGGIIA